MFLISSIVNFRSSVCVKQGPIRYSGLSSNNESTVVL